MQRAMRFASAVEFFVGLAVLSCGLAVFTSAANAQTAENAVYNSSGATTSSPAFIDASVFGSSATDICAVLYGILSSTSITYPAVGAVIDARGLPGATGTNMTCASGTTPWYNGSSFANVPSTILLPAQTIVISSTWKLPSNTHLIGEGEATLSGTTPDISTIQASSTFSTPGPFLQFGSSSICGSSQCTGISVERLTLDGKGGSFNGIVNEYAGNASVVDHVRLYQIRGIGLLVDSSAYNSGPYSNITFDTGTYSGTTGTVCAQILNVSGSTHGIHGLYCHSETNDAPAAVLLDSSNNSLEDVTIAGFYDGVRVGGNGIAQSNVLLNVTGDTSHTSLTPVNTVHISTNYAVTDLSIMGASNSGLSGTTTIQDDVTSTTIQDATVAMYALGEAANGGHSRYTTSPRAATWGSGTNAPSGTCASSASGSLFSNSSGGTGVTALWVCPANLSGANWKPIM